MAYHIYVGTQFQGLVHAPDSGSAIHIWADKTGMSWRIFHAKPAGDLVRALKAPKAKPTPQSATV